MRIRWTPSAAADLEHISDYLQEHHPHYRQPTMRRRYEAIRSLKQSPRPGRPGSQDGTRELLFPPLPYGRGLPRDGPECRSAANLSWSPGQVLTRATERRHLTYHAVTQAGPSRRCRALPSTASFQRRSQTTAPRPAAAVRTSATTSASASRWAASRLPSNDCNW